MALTSKQKDRQGIFNFMTELELADLSEEFKQRLQNQYLKADIVCPTPREVSVALQKEREQQTGP